MFCGKQIKDDTAACVRLSLLHFACKYKKREKKRVKIYFEKALSVMSYVSTNWVFHFAKISEV